MAISSKNFNVDSNGNMSCNNAEIKGGYIGIPLEERSNIGEANLGITDANGIMSTWVNGNGFHCKTDYAVFHASCDSDSEIYIANNGNYTSIKPSGIITPKLTQTSKEENKKNFEKIKDNAIEIIKNIDIYKYNLKSEKDTDKKHIGFVIGDNYNYSKEVTSLDNTGVDNYSFTSLCCKAIQEQQKIIEKLQNKIEEMEERINGQN